MPKFLSYQRPQPTGRTTWTGRQGAPVPKHSHRHPKLAPEAEKPIAPLGVDLDAILKNGKAEKKSGN